MPGRSLNSIITTSPDAAHARQSAPTDASRAKHAPPLYQRAITYTPAPRPAPHPATISCSFLGGGGLRFGLMSSPTAILLGQAHQKPCSPPLRTARSSPNAGVLQTTLQKRAREQISAFVARFTALVRVGVAIRREVQRPERAE